MSVESSIINGNIDSVDVKSLKVYLKFNGLSDKGKKEELINRVLSYIADKSTIWSIEEIDQEMSIHKEIYKMMFLLLFFV